MFRLFGLGHYLPYALLPIVVHVVIVVLVWLLLLRAGIRPWIAAALGAVLAVMGVGVENTLWDFQIGFMGPVAFGLAAVLLMPGAAGRLRRDGLVLLLVLAGLMTSGQGLVMLVVVAVHALLTRGVRFAGLVAGGGLATYLIWYAAVGHAGTASDSITASSLAGVPRIVLIGLAHVWDGLSGLPGAGAVVLVAALVALVRADGRPGWARRTHLATSCLAGAVTLFVLTGLTRNQSVAQASASRYAYIAACLTAPAVAVALQWLLGDQPVRRRVTQGVALAVTAGLLLTGFATVYRFRVERVQTIGDLHQRLAAAAALASSGQRLLNDKPSPDFNPQATASLLVAAQRAGRGITLHPTAAELADAASFLQVRVGLSPIGAPAATAITLRGAVLTGVSADGCREGRAVQRGNYLEVPTAGPMELHLRTSAVKLLTRLLRDGRRSDTATWHIRPGADEYVAATVPAGDVLEIVFDQPVTFELCP